MVHVCTAKLRHFYGLKKFYLWKNEALLDVDNLLYFKDLRKILFLSLWKVFVVERCDEFI